MKAKRIFLSVSCMLLLVTSNLLAQKTSTGNDWSNANHWSPVGVPTSSDDVIIDTDMSVPAAGGPYEVNAISYSHNQTNTLTIDGELRLVGTSPEFDNTGGPGEFGALVVSAGGVLRFGNGTTPVDLSDASATGVAINGTFQLNAEPAGSDIIVATWGSGSVCKIDGVQDASGKVIGNLDQDFYDFVWDCASQSNFMEFNGLLSQVFNDLIIENTGTGSLVFDTGNVPNYSLTIGNDFTINDGGAALLAASGSTTATISIGGDFEWYNDLNSTPTALSDGQDVVISVYGDLIIDGGNDNSFDFATLIVGGGPSTTLELYGDFLHFGGIINVDDATANASLKFVGSPSVFDNSAASAKQADDLNFVVPNGRTLEVEPNSSLISNGVFTVENGGTLRVLNASGLDNSTGIVQVATRNYESESSIVYNGALSQMLGDGFPSGEQVNIEIDNPNGVTNDVITNGTTTLEGSLVLTSGSLIIGDHNSLELNGPITSISGAIKGYYNSSDNVGTSKLVIGGSAAEVITGDISFDPAGNGNILNELQIARPVSVPLGSDLIIEGTIINSNGVLDLAGVLDIKANTLTLGGVFVDNGGSIASNGGSLVLNGTGDMGDAIGFSSGSANIENLTVNRTTGGVVHLGSGAQVDGLLYLQNGEADLDAALSIGDMATINRGSGFLSGADLNFLGTYNLIYSVSTSTGKEMVDDLSPGGETAINNLSISGGASVVLTKDIFINGDLTTSGSTFDGSTNQITFSGPGINTITGSNITLGDVTIESGAQVEGSNNTTYLKGVWTNNAGVSGFDGRNGTMEFSGSGTQVINSSGAPFNSVRFSTLSSNKDITGDLMVKGNFIINSGVTVSTNSNISVGNTWQNLGTFDAGTGTVTFDGGSQSIDSQGDAFYNLTLQGAATTKTLASAVVILNDLNIGSGVTLSNGGGSIGITIGGSWINDGVAFNSGPTGIVTFNGANSVAGATSTQFSSVVISGSSFVSETSMKVARNWSVSTGTFDHGGETITFNGNSNQAIDPGNIVYNNWTFAGPGTKTLNDDVALDGDLLLNAGPFNASGRTITIGGDFSKAGGVNFSTGANLIFDGGAQLFATSNQSFNSIQFNPGTNITITAGSTITTQDLIANGTFAEPITIQSSSAGTEATFSQSSGVVDGNHLVLMDIHGTGGATFNATNSTDLGNNDGWIFTSNNPPTDIALSNSSVDEEQPINTEVGTLSSTDPDGSDSHSYSLVSGAGDDDNASFNISGNKLRTSEIFDFETKSAYTIRIETNDGNGGLFEEQFDISVVDITENSVPTNISLSPSSVNEGLVIGTLVGDLATTDSDVGDTHTYQLVAGSGDTDNASFTISGDQVLTAEVFDFETKSSYSIRIQTDDGHSGTFEKEFSITINDVVENDPPTDITLTNSTIDEGQPVGTTVGVLNTTDADVTDVHSYTFVTGSGDSDNASFTISGDQLLSSEVFDFETKSSYSIRIQTNDGNAGTFEKSLTITVNDVIENDPPTDITLSNSTIDEGLASGTAVGILSTSDPNTSDTHTYQLVSGTGDSDNTSFTISADQLLSVEVFDFETKSSYSIRVQTNDGNAGTYEKSLTITVNDVVENDPPSDISLSVSSIDEGLALGTVVGTLSTADSDGGDTHTYQLVSGTGDSDNSSFSISGDQLLSAEVFDFETKSSYSIRISTNDGHAGTFEKEFTITITDVVENNAPTDISLSGTSIDEGLTIGTLIGDFSTTDPDGGDTHTYSLSSGAGDADNASFSISGGQLLSAEVFDFDVQSSYSIRVASNDGNGGVFAKEFVIEINEVPITGIDEIYSTSITVYPNPATNVVYIESSGATDLEFQLLGGDGALITKGQLVSGKAELDVTHLIGGLYLLKVSNSSSTSTFKLLK